MMEKHFMIDIETTGIDPNHEDLLQIGILEAEFVDGLWRPRREFELVQHTDRQPTSEFAKTHMAKLYEVCNRAPKWAPQNIRWMLLDFFKQCGATPPEVYLMGWNASNFDVPFLVAKGALQPSFYEAGPDGKDVMKGDFHYRIYELGGALSLIANKFPKADRKQIIEQAKAADSVVSLPPGKEHDAIYDCYAQLKILNGLISLSHDDYFPYPAEAMTS